MTVTLGDYVWQAEVEPSFCRLFWVRRHKGQGRTMQNRHNLENARSATRQTLGKDGVASGMITNAFEKADEGGGEVTTDIPYERGGDARRRFFVAARVCISRFAGLGRIYAAAGRSHARIEADCV